MRNPPKSGYWLVLFHFKCRRVSNRVFFSKKFAKSLNLEGITMSRRVFLACSIFAALSFGTQAFAAEGKYDGTSCYAGPAQIIQQAEGFIAGSYQLTGMLPGQQGTPIYRLSGTCNGQFTVVAGEEHTNGSCQLSNTDGDKVFGLYERKGDPLKVEGNWRVVQATGKLAGMTWEGKYLPIGAFPPVPGMITVCQHEWGTWTTK
jgi:hypothetical protein